jgi:hypothetical protein
MEQKTEKFEKQGISSVLNHCDIDRIEKMRKTRLRDIPADVLRASNWDEYRMSRSWDLAVAANSSEYRFIFFDLPFEIAMTPVRYLKYQFYKQFRTGDARTA